MTERTFSPLRVFNSRRSIVADPAPSLETPTPAVAEHLALVDSALYRNGARESSPETIEETCAELRAEQFDESDRIAWIGLYRPDHITIARLADEFELHELAVEDAIVAHQRPKLERYGDTLFVVLRAARYDDESETVEFGELHVFVGSDFVATVRHSEAPDLSAVRRRLESNPDLLSLGSEAVLYAILDRIVDDYAPVVEGLSNDIDEIETQVFGGDPSVSRRIYELNREVIEFQRAVHPLSGMLRALMAGFNKYHTDEELQRLLRDVADHLTQVVEQVNGFKQLLRDMLTVNATLVAQQQNEEMRILTEHSLAQAEEVKRISAWAAIIFAPSLLSSIYGMNFTNMPELDQSWGYPVVLIAMVACCFGLWLAFRFRGWL